MSCTDLFVAAVAVGCGLTFGKEMWTMVSELPKLNPEKKLWCVLYWVVVVSVVVYLGYQFDNTFIPFP